MTGTLVKHSRNIPEFVIFETMTDSVTNMKKIRAMHISGYDLIELH